MNERTPSADNHCKAFSTFVEAGDDVVGLPAYASYKRTINERRLKGLPTPDSAHRDPQAHEFELYRTQAINYLKAFGDSVIQSERAAIIREGVQQSVDHVVGAVTTAQVQLSKEVRAATGFWWPGVAVSVVAWVLSIILTIVVAYSAPEWVTGLVRHLAPR